MNDIGERGGNIGQDPEPPNARSGANRLDRQPNPIGIQEPREINSRCRTERVKSPSAGVHVEKFVTAVTRIALIFDFDQTVIVNGLNKTLGKFFDDRRFGRFNISCGAAKLARMLAKAARDQRAVGFSMANECAP